MEDVSRAKNFTKDSRKISTKQLVVMAMLAAISIVFISVVHFPIFPAAPFLEYDPADIPILIGTFLYGPVAGFLLTVVVCLIQGATVSAASGGIIGIVMHVVATGSCTLIAGAIYKKYQTNKSAVVALAIGALTMTLAMVLMNLILTPVFMGTPVDVVIPMLIPIIIPFNLLKSGINCIITYLLFKSIVKAMDKIR